MWCPLYDMCFCVNFRVFLSPRILHPNDYIKHSEEPVSLSNMSWFCDYCSNKCRAMRYSNLNRSHERQSWTELALLLVVKWQRAVLVEITSCNYTGRPNVQSFYCFFPPSLLISPLLLFPFTPASLFWSLCPSFAFLYGLLYFLFVACLSPAFSISVFTLQKH